MSSVNYKKKYVVTYKEIVLIFITFSIILFVLYPRDFLMKQILNEKDNYDLSMLYLKNMLKNDPTNEVLMLTLTKQSLATGKKDLSIKLLELLKNSKNKEVREETYLLTYKLLKDDYFYLESINSVKRLQSTSLQLKELMNLIIKTPIKSNEDLEELYQETQFLNDTKNAYILLKKLLEIHPNNLAWNKDAFYLSSELSYKKEAMFYINKLVALDKKNSLQWQESKYYFLLKDSNYSKSETFLKTKSKHSIFWKKKLISFYEYNQKYKNVAKIHMQSFTNTSVKKQQRYHWLKAVNALKYGQHTRGALALASKYEDYFIQDKRARIGLLNLYLSLNELQKANALSKKILKRKLQ
ncbi:MAG: hypothetical protein COB42_05350 [Sulfurimonas sp.]|nr:MAG: hypothetical protein COB42_05350 [Sulfurimonas sp.]